MLLFFHSSYIFGAFLFRSLGTGEAFHQASTLKPKGHSFISLSDRCSRPLSFVHSKHNDALSHQQQRQQYLLKTSALFGILDEVQSDAFTLGGSDDGNDINMNDAYEMFLADLVFSTNDPRVDIMNKFDLATDEKFVEWLENKINDSNDPEERTALRDLYDMVIDVKTKIDVNKMAEERAAREAEQAEQLRIQEAEKQAEIGRSMSTADVLKKAAAIQTAGMDTSSHDDNDVAPEKTETFYDQQLTPEIRLSYEPLLKKVLPPYKAGETPTMIVSTYYEEFDAQFVKVLNERTTNGDVDCKALLEALALEQQKCVQRATETLKEVLSQGEPMRMEGAIIKLAREGRIDEAFLLLLEANADQARAAGATGPAEVMIRLKQRAIEEKDKQTTSKEIRLLRQLLRNDDPQERERLLEEAFTPKEALIVPGTAENAQKAVDGEMPEQEKAMPDVPPPDFINACKAVLLNFGNLDARGNFGSEDSSEDRGDLATRIKRLAAEAEVVATRIYGQGMTLREQQDRMWKEQTTSIFDLEQMELEAEQRGESAPWTDPNADDDMFLPGFDKDGRMQVGGGSA